MTETSSTEDRLLAAMDRAALYFISILDNDEKDEDGNDKYDIQLKMKLFDKGESWLTKRKKLRPSTEGVEGEGITDMRAWINEPGNREALKTVMFEEGFVKIPEPKVGRPKKQEEVVRERYKAHKDAAKAKPDPNDDSGWKGLMEEEAT